MTRTLSDRFAGAEACAGGGAAGVRQDCIPVELLAPARDKECAMAAIDHGADAVYIGAERFGARAAACNSDDDIAEVVRYAHPFGVRVYVTLNTLLAGDDELRQACSLAWRMYRMGVDALIVQDARLARMPGFPPIPLHASTQMDNRTADKVRELQRQGYRQVVLARELTVGEVAGIHRSVPDMPLEVFVHGAVCVCYNGRCHASEVCYGRSADRGECAQFCRMPYDLENAEGEKLLRGRYLLSMRDMNRTDCIEALLDAGARSLKIEGRLKDVAYVKNVTAWYRQRLDDIFRRRTEYCAASYGVTELAFAPDPYRTFNRGFTDYFVHGRTADLCNMATPKSMGERVGFVKEMRRDHIVVAGTASFSNGDGLCYLAGRPGREELVGFRINRAEGNHLYPHRMPQGLTDGTEIFRNQDRRMEGILAGNTATRYLPLAWTVEETPRGFRLTAHVVDGAQDAPLRSASLEFGCDHQLARIDQEASVRETLSRLGDTIYRATDIDISFSQPWFIPRSSLTQWRREVLEALEAQGMQDAQGTRDMPASQGTQAVPCDADAAAAYDVPCDGEAVTGDPSRPRNGADRPLMVCRYCVRYQLGQCLRRNPKAVRGPLYLRGADGRRFLLGFDCRLCRMTVEMDGR